MTRSHVDTGYRRAVAWAVASCVVAGCATAQVTRDDVKSSVLTRDLAAAFARCGRGTVEQRSPTEYRVSACDEVAIYACQDPSYTYLPRCTLEAVRPAPRPAVGVAQAAGGPRARGAPSISRDRRAEADRLFDEARALARDRRQAEACARFTRSDAIVRTFGTALNLGDCALRDGHAGRAWQLYDDAARVADRGGNANLAQYARDQAAALAPQLWTIIVTIADSNFADLTVRIGEREFPPGPEIRALLDPGQAEVVVSVGGVPVLRRMLRGVAGSIATAELPAHVTPVR
jgi:hypothetical protein